MSSSSNSPNPKSKPKPLFVRKLQDFLSKKTPSASDSNLVGLAIQPVAHVAGTVGSSSIMSSGQEPGPLVKPSTDKTWTPFRLALKDLHSCEYPGVLSPLQSAIGALCTSLDLMDMTTDNDQEQSRLVSGLTAITESLTRHINDPNRNPAGSEAIDRAVKSLNACVAKIESKRETSGIRRFGEAQLRHEEILQYCQEIERILQQIQIEITLSSLGLLDRISVNNKLHLLNPSKLARYDSESSTGVNSKGCTPGTRKDILFELESWSDTLAGPRLQWMSGMAGTGKTTIAYTYSKNLDSHRRLAASFFCSRRSPECRDASRIVPTLAYQLARFSPAFRAELCVVLNEDPDLGHSNIPKQFECLLQAPFKNIGRMPENMIVVLDALDECENPDSMGTFLRHLLECVDELPLKFFITSRPEPKIHLKLTAYQVSRSTQPMSPLHEMDKSRVQADIKLYLQQGLASMSLPDIQLMKLVDQCGSLFIYAATLVRYIQPEDKSIPSTKRLEQILVVSGSHKKMDAELDKLYSVVLSTAVDYNLEGREVDEVQAVLRTVLCAQEPISVETITMLCGVDNPSFALERMRSVVHISEANDLVSVFHASFPDFMFDRERSNTWFCDRANHNSLMAKQCFSLMKELRFNMCQIESSYVPDKVLEQEGKINIDDTVKPSLWYACCYWANHLDWARASEDFVNQLRDFISQRLLFWVEVLNLKHDLVLGAGILHKASLWLDTGIIAHKALAPLVEDARNFVTSFASSPASISTPHLYLSFLPFCPRSSSVSQNYRNKFRGLVEPDQRVMHARELAALASWRPRLGSENSQVTSSRDHVHIDSDAPSLAVLSVAYSHDGTRIAFGCYDGTVGVLNSYDGVVIFGIPGGSELGHDRLVRSVAFSPGEGKISNQAYLASGSSDGTIRTWNLRDGTVRSVCCPDPLPGRTTPGGINSISFSPKCDGNIASGSSDRTVCIWDSSNGNLIAGPFHGHTAAIGTVVFSPDGACVASGSEDRTIRIWNPQNGQLVLGPLTAQTGHIHTIAFSPDGTRMASGSDDKSICVWDPHKGTIVCGPFPAHNNPVFSVTFSPNGKHLASCSYDRSIRVWDPLNGNPTAGPFEGHTDPVFSIAFSPDSTRITSGSSDGTIRLWDPRQGTLSDGVLQSHSDSVKSVAFSPDGKHVASCSHDGTVRVWDICDNLPVAGGAPLDRHDGAVMCLAFSSDGAWVVTGSSDQTARVWAIRHASITPVTFKEHTDAIWSVAVSPDDSFVASTGGWDDNMIRLWNPSTGASISSPLVGHTSAIFSVAISPDGAHLTSGSCNGTLRVWDLKSKEILRVLEGHTQAVWSIAYSHDGTKLASGSSDGTILVWALQNDAVATSPMKIDVPGGWVNSVAFSPDGGFIASGADDHAVRLWRSDTGESVGDLYEGHFDSVTSVAFSPYGTHVASGSDNGTIRFWDIRNLTSMAIRQGTGVDVIADGKWEVQWDGWVKQGSNLLLCIPPECAHSLVMPPCASIISSSGPLQVDFSKLKLGRSWQECYVAQPNVENTI